LTVANWTPATELPEERIRVIAAQPDYIVGECFYGDSFRDSLGKCWRYTGRLEEPLPAHLQPTHWQPLPDAPGVMGLDRSKT
jgi:hypothetical protein